MNKEQIPKGWKECKGASTAPVGYKWINNGKSRFGGEYKNKLIKAEKQNDGKGGTE